MVVLKRMPWGWEPRHEARAQSHAEPSSTKPWKEHTAQVLQRLLTSKSGRFKADDITDPIQKYVYLQEQVQAGVQAEAEADLVRGFRAWLQGTHAENRPGRTDTYQNKADGRPHRRKMDGTKYANENTDWQSTPWGDAQLTHLPGVREWLRENAIATDKADLEMQLLAEYGPHDLESAWRYYKHWVLKRPISYPHAHAQAPSEEGWHGPGMASAAHPRGWAPRRSSHFDALPPPPPPPPEEYDMYGGSLFAGFSEFPDPPDAQYERELNELEPAAALSSIGNATPPPTPSQLREAEIERLQRAIEERRQSVERLSQEPLRSEEVFPALAKTPNTQPRRSGREAAPTNFYGF